MADDAVRVPWADGAVAGALGRVAGTARAAAVRWATVTAAFAGRIPVLVVDLGLAVAFLTVMVAGRVTAADALGDRFLAALALSVVIAGSLVARRRAPLAAYLVGTAGLIAGALWTGPDPVAPYPNLIGLYSLGLYASRGRARLGPVLALPASSRTSRPGTTCPPRRRSVCCSYGCSPGRSGTAARGGGSGWRRTAG